MIHVTKEDVRMTEATEKWEYVAEDGYIHLREDAPPEIKKHNEKMRKKYDALSFE